MKKALLLLTVVGVALLVHVFLRDAEEARTTGAEGLGRGSGDAAAESAPTLIGTGTGDGAARRPREHGVAVRGLVVDARGDGVSGIEVLALPDGPRRAWRGNQGSSLDWLGRPPEEPPSPLATTTSDGEGRFLFAGLDGTGTVSFVARPRAPRVGATRRVDLHEGGRREIRLVVLDGHPLRLRVVDEAGRGVPAWVSVTLHGGAMGAAGSAGWFNLDEQRTDAQGRRQVEALPEGVVRVGVRVPRRLGRSFLVSVPEAEEVVLPLYVARGVRLHGTVRNEASGPVAGARVLARLSAAGPVAPPGAMAMAETDADGRWVIDRLPPGLLGEVLAEADGYRIRRWYGGRKPLAAGGEEKIDLTLERGVALHGTVTDGEGRPLEGVLVRAGPTDGNQPGAPDAHTDADGRYRIENLPVGGASVVGWLEGWYQPAQTQGNVESATPAGTSVRLVAEADENVVDLVLYPGVPVTGRVMDEEGAPIPGAVVAVQGDDTQPAYLFLPYSAPLSFTRNTDAAGAFRYEGLAPGIRWKLVATHEGRGATEQLPEPLDPDAPVPNVRIVVHRFASIAGVVVDPSGTPVPRVPVVCRRSTAVRSDAEGRFEILHLEAGTYEVRARTGSFGRRNTPVRVDVAWGERTEDLRLEVPTPWTIAGVVVKSDGAPLTGVPLELKRVGQRGFPQALTGTDAQGTFRARVWEEGLFEVSVGGHVFPTHVEAGDENVRLVYETAHRGAVVIHIVGPDGAPVPQVQLRVMHGTETSLSGSTETVDGGTYRLATKNLGPVVHVDVTDPKDEQGEPLPYAPAHVANVDVEEPELAIQLQAGRSLTGVVVDEGGAPVAGVTVFLSPEDGTATTSSWVRLKSDADGRFSAETLPPGTLTAWVTPSGPWLRSPAVRVSPDEREVRLVLRRGAEFRVLVLDPQGKPVEGARVQASWHAPAVGWARADTGEDGVATFGGLSPEAVLSLNVRPPREAGLPNVGRQDVPYGQGSVTIQLPSPVTIEGIALTEEGLPYRGSINAHGADEVTLGSYGHVRPDPETGRFVIERLKPGSYFVYALGGTEYVRSRWREVHAPAKDVRIVAPRGVELKGRLHVDDVKGWSIGYHQATQHSCPAIIDPDGRFRVLGARNEPGALHATREGDDRTVLLEDVKPSDGPFRLRPVQGGCIAGRVVDAGGGAEGLVVYLRRSEVRIIAPLAEGAAFDVQGVPPGAWDVEVWRGGRQVGGVEDVEAGTTDVEVTVE